MKNNKYDVVIVGGGAIGGAVAYYLSLEKKLSVALVDIRKVGTASWSSTGGLWHLGESVGLGCGVIFHKTISRKKQESQDIDINNTLSHILPDYFFEYSYQSSLYFEDLWKDLKRTSGIDVNLERSGLLFVMYNQYDEQYMEMICEHVPPHLQHSIKKMTKAKLHKQEPYITKEAIGALKLINDDQLNPFLLTIAYLNSAQANGVTVFYDEEVVDVDIENNRVVAVETDQRRIRCDMLVNAAGAWARDIGNMVDIELPIDPVKGEIILSQRLPKMLHSCLSTSDCYIAQKDHGEILIGSTTEDDGFRTICKIDKLRELAQGAIKALPFLNDMKIKRTWAGLRPGTPDELPILGPVYGLEGYLNACGHFRTGIVNSPITGQIIRSLIMGRETPVDITPFLFKRFFEE